MRIEISLFLIHALIVNEVLNLFLQWLNGGFVLVENLLTAIVISFSWDYILCNWFQYLY